MLKNLRQAIEKCKMEETKMEETNCGDFSMLKS